MRRAKEKMRLIIALTVTQSIGCGGERSTHLVQIGGGSHGVQSSKNYRTAW
jgi:hypothetical protein